MAGYTARQSTYTSGDTILAAHTNDEFNTILASFDATTGHSHDGSAGEGAFVPLIADSDSNNKLSVDSVNNRFGLFVEVTGSPVEQLRFQDGAIVPVTTNDIDLGTSSLEFKDAYFDGVVTVDSLALPTTTITDILDPKRDADKGDDLWRVFNVIQEKITQGDFHAALTGAKVRKVRKIKSFEKDMKVNKELFKLATALV